MCILVSCVRIDISFLCNYTFVGQEWQLMSLGISIETDTL